MTDVVFSVPVGPDGLTYSGGAPDDRLVGPNAFDLGDDGTFWISDTRVRRVRRYAADGKPLGSVDLSGAVAGVTDLRVTSGSLHVLDLAAERPGILRRDLVGEAEAFEPLSDGFSGPAGARSLAVRRMTVDGRGVVSGSAAAADVETVRLARPGYVVGGVRPLATGPAGDSWLLVEEVALDGPVVKVIQTVRHHDAGGALTGMATVPLGERVVHVDEGVRLGPDGEIYALVPRQATVDVVRLALEAPPVPMAISQAVTSDVRPMQHGGTCDTRACEATLASYLNNVVELTDANINGHCPGREKPFYLLGPGRYGSVPYDWGGFDTPEEFSRYMAEGRQAGDVATRSVEVCSKGVDCSGFVSRVWQLETKHSTSMLPGVAFPIGTIMFARPFDIFNQSEDHVILVVALEQDGFRAAESTKSSNFDRVVERHLDWSYVNDYTHLRSKQFRGCDHE